MSSLTALLYRFVSGFGTDRTPDTVGGKKRVLTDQSSTLKSQQAFIKQRRWGVTEEKFMRLLARQTTFEVIDLQGLRLSQAPVKVVKKLFGKHVYDRYVRTLCRPVRGGSSIKKRCSDYNFTAVLLGWYLDALRETKKNRELILGRLQAAVSSFHEVLLALATKLQETETSKDSDYRVHPVCQRREPAADSARTLRAFGELVNTRCSSATSSKLPVPLAPMIPRHLEGEAIGIPMTRGCKAPSTSHSRIS